MTDTAKKTIWTIIHGVNALLLFVPYLLLIALNGFSIFPLLLGSRYSAAFFFFIAATIIIMAACVYLAIREIRSVITNRAAVHDLIRTISAVVMCISIPTNLVLVNKAATGPADSTPSASTEFNVKAGPFLEPGPFKGRLLGSPDTMVIWWIDPRQADEKRYVQYGLSPYPRYMEKAFVVKSDGRRHEARLSGLKPGKKYYYRIPGYDNKTYSFETLPDSGSDSVHIFAAGDTGNTTTGGYAFSYYERVLELAGSYYRKNRTAPALRINLGDNVKYGSDLRAWEKFLVTEQEHASRVPTVYAMGNHEYLKDYGSNFKYFFSHPDYYSFDYGHAHVIVVHPYDGFMLSPDGPLVTTGRKQYAFIQNELKKNFNRKWTIVCIHNPILSTGDYNMNELLVRQYRDLFRKYRVDLVLSGHDHNYDSFWVDKDTSWGGTFYIVAGTGGSKSDSYIMTRRRNKWRSWSHDRSSETGLYQHDRFAKKYHQYGELSWGFLDIEISKDELKTGYFRWINIEAFLELTSQKLRGWEMIPFSDTALKQNNISGAELVHSMKKTRTFQ